MTSLDVRDQETILLALLEVSAAIPRLEYALHTCWRGPPTNKPRIDTTCAECVVFPIALRLAIATCVFHVMKRILRWVVGT